MWIGCLSKIYHKVATFRSALFLHYISIDLINKATIWCGSSIVIEEHTSQHRYRQTQHHQWFIISMGVITSPKSPFNCRDSILKDQICCQLTFCGCFLQCEATCLHASHAQNSFVDPVHVGGHLSVDVKRFVLKSTINIKSGEIKATLTHLSEPPRLAMPAKIPSTVKAPPLSPWGI